MAASLQLCRDPLLRPALRGTNFNLHAPSCFAKRLAVIAAVAEPQTRQQLTVSAPSADSIKTQPSVQHVRTQDSEDSNQPVASTSSGPTASELFDDQHVASWNPALALYFPFGCVLAAFRMTLWVLGVALDLPVFRNPVIIDSYLWLLGFRMKWNHMDRIPSEKHILVSNHQTVGDLMMLFRLPQRYTHLITTAMPAQVTCTANLPVVLKAATPEVYDQLASSSSSAEGPVHVFPEGGMTNGRAGMMHFTRGFMKFVGDQPVVPVALKARTAFNIRTHTLLSSFLANLFWFSFCPWIEIEATVLPPMKPLEGEGRGAFVQRVQKVIAEELKVGISDINIQQKRRIMQRAALRQKK